MRVNFGTAVLLTSSMGGGKNHPCEVVQAIRDIGDRDSGVGVQNDVRTYMYYTIYIHL